MDDVIISVLVGSRPVSGVLAEMGEEKAQAFWGLRENTFVKMLTSF